VALHTVSASMMRPAIHVVRFSALALVALMALGMPILRALHEAEHHQHDAQAMHRLIDGAGAFGPVALSECDNDDCGSCALCGLIQVATHQQALLDRPCALPCADASFARDHCPLIVQQFTPELTREPSARGPPCAA
jgi:hypothetical protein